MVKGFKKRGHGSQAASANKNSELAREVQNALARRITASIDKKAMRRAAGKIIFGAAFCALSMNFLPDAAASLEDYQDGRYLAVSFSESPRELKQIASEAGKANVSLLFVGTGNGENVALFAEKVGWILPKENVPTVLIAPDIILHLGISAVPAYFELRSGSAEAVICGSSELSYLNREYGNLAHRANIFSGSGGYAKTCADAPSFVIGPVLPFFENNAIKDAQKKTSEWIASGKAYEAARQAIKKPASRMMPFKTAHLGKAADYSKKRISPVIRLTDAMRSEVSSAIREARKIIAGMPEKDFLENAEYGAAYAESTLSQGIALGELIAPMTRYVIFDASDECELKAAKTIAGDGRFYVTALLANFSEDSISLDEIARYLGTETYPLPASVARNLGVDSTLAVATARGAFFEVETFAIEQCAETQDKKSDTRETAYDAPSD